MKTNLRFIFDTNALISVALLANSTNKLALQKAEKIGKIFFSESTLLELSDVLARKKFDKYLTIEDRLDFVTRIKMKYDLADVLTDFTDCTDPKDNKFLNLAFDIGASCIISGDKHLLQMHPFRNISILNAADFLLHF